MEAGIRERSVGKENDQEFESLLTSDLRMKEEEEEEVFNNNEAGGKVISGGKVRTNTNVSVMGRELLEKEVLKLRVSNAKLEAALKGAGHNQTVRRNEEYVVAHDKIIHEIINKSSYSLQPGIVEESWDTKRTNIGIVIHDDEQLVLHFILTDASTGVFRRATIHEGEEGGRIVFWQHYLRGGMKVVEYLLEISVSRESSGSKITLKSLEEKDVPLSAQMKLNMIVSPKNAQRAKIEGVLRVNTFELQQSTLTFVGTFEAENQGGDRIDNERSKRKKTNIEVNSHKRAASSTLLALADNSDINTIFVSIKDIFDIVEKHFHKPEVIDERRKREFVENYILKAPILTKDEVRMLESLDTLPKTLAEKGKRVRSQSLKSGIDKFQWKEGKNHWGAFRVTVDKSAEDVLAEQFLLESLIRSEMQAKKGGHLPRAIKTNVDGSRSMHYHIGFKIPTITNRIFENWFVWKKIHSSNGRAAYMLGFVPVTEYQGGGGFAHLSKEGYKLAETTGIYYISEIAPNVSQVLRIQTVDFHSDNLPDFVINLLARSQLVKAERLQEHFRRNGKEVDAEVREVVMKRMADGIELDKEQEKVLREMSHLFEEDKESGWEHLDSPYEGVEMEFKYHQQVKGKKSLVFGRAVGYADCTAEEASAWYFEGCSRERLERNWKNKSPMFEVIRLKGNKVNEKTFAAKFYLPIPFKDREAVFKQMWHKNGNVMSVAIWSVEEFVDWGDWGRGNLERLVRANTMGLLTVTNLANAGGVPQCRIQLTLYFDAGGHIPLWLGEKVLPSTLGAMKVSRSGIRGAGAGGS
jgi:hypothetical protein